MATGPSGLPAIAVEPQRFAAACALREASRKPAETMAMASAEVLVRPDRLPGDGRDLMARVSVVTQALPIAAARVVVLSTLATGPGSSRFWASGVPHAGSWPWSCGAASWRCCAPALCSGSCSAPRPRPSCAGRSRCAPRSRLAVAIGAAAWRLVATVATIGLVLAALPAALACRQPFANGPHADRPERGESHSIVTLGS
jgi:hypothetical protein